MDRAGEDRAVEAILGLGSNIGNKAQNIEEAIALLTADDDVALLARSRLYRSAPWGVTDQDWFVNACIKVCTSLSPSDLLSHCQSVENAMGRVRERHWGPRIIDVDILIYGDRNIHKPGLVVPHPHIGERAFVLVPLLEIAPQLEIGSVSIRSTLAKLDAGDVIPLDTPTPGAK